MHRHVKLCRLLQKHHRPPAKMTRDVHEVQVKNLLLDNISVFVYTEPELCRRLRCPGTKRRPAGPRGGGGGGFEPPSPVAAGRIHRQVMAALGGGGRPPPRLASSGRAPELRAHLLVCERGTCSPPTPHLRFPGFRERTPPGPRPASRGGAGRGCAGSRRAPHSSLFPRRLARVGARAGMVA